MGVFRRVFRHAPTDRRDAEASVDEELAFHMAEAEQEWMERGASPADARDRAQAEFGDLAEARAYCVAQQTKREQRRGWSMWIDEVRQDVAFAFRTLVKAPAYAAIVVVTLAVGIAANTVIFSLMNPYFFRALPFEDEASLVQLGLIDTRQGWDGARFSLDMVDDYTGKTSAFQDLGTYYYGNTNLTGPEGPERLQIGYLSENMFDVLGSLPEVGRTFASGEGGPGGADVVVISWGLWQRRWAGDPGIVGRSVALDGVPHSVIGVMPQAFNFPFGGVKLWVPIRASSATEDRGEDYYIPVARLTENWTAEAAQTDLNRIHGELATSFPTVDGEFGGTSVKPIREALNFAWDVLRISMAVLLGAVFFVLAIACVNVASLTLARSQQRAREVAIRAAIGAGRQRIVRQLVTESLLLALIGGSLGSALAFWLVGMLGPLVPEDLFKVGEMSVDGSVLAFTLVVTLMTPLLFGLLPALRVAKVELATALREGGRGGSGLRALRGRRLLVVAELALAVVLVTGTGLMLRSMDQVQNVDLGYRADRILTTEVTPPASQYESQAELNLYFQQANEALASIPGVEAVGNVYPMPLNHESIPLRFVIPGQEPPGGEVDWPSALWASVSVDFFEAMGIPLLTGRAFNDSDADDGELAVIVSRSLVDRFFNGQEVLGRTLTLAENRAATIVGVAGNIVHSEIQTGSPELHIYQPQSQNTRRRRFLVARTISDPASYAASVREGLLRLDADLPVTIRPMNDIVLENTLQWSLGSTFLGVFGIVAVLLASMGVYGLIAYSVSQRSQELGIRIAMGAGASEIRSLVVGEGLRLTLIGGGIGLAAALVLSRVIASVLFEVSPFDPVTLVSVILLFSIIALTASLIPASRATRVDPVHVLRAD